MGDLLLLSPTQMRSSHSFHARTGYLGSMTDGC